MNILRPTTHQKGLTDGGELYEISCFFYLVAGVIRFHQGSNLDATNLILQSIISFVSDVIFLGKSSIWHPIDRYFAVYTCGVHFYTLKYSMSIILNLIILLIGYNFLVRSQKLYLEDDPNFSVYHVFWHTASIFMALTSDL